MHFIQEVPPTYARNAAAFQAASPSLVFVHVTWCGFCKQARPLLEQVSAALGPQFPIYAIDADKLPDVAAELGVKSFPTIFMMTQKSIKKFEGERTFDNLIGFICDNSADASGARGYCLKKSKK